MVKYKEMYDWEKAAHYATEQELQKLKNKIIGLEDSLRNYRKERDNYEQSSHISNFIYELNVNEKGEIPCLIKANGVEHTLGITERDVKSFTHVFQMGK